MAQRSPLRVGLEYIERANCAHAPLFLLRGDIAVYHLFSSHIHRALIAIPTSPLPVVLFVFNMPVSSRQLVSLLALVATIPLASAHGSLTKIDVAGKSYPAWIPNQDHYAAMNFANGAGAAAPDGKYSVSAVVSIERTGVRRS